MNHTAPRANVVIPSEARNLLFPAGVLASLLICAVSVLHAQQPAPPEGVSLADEPHHHLVFQNNLVNAYYVEVSPRESTLVHRHEFDYIFVSLGAADIINAAVGKPELHQQLRDEEIHFARGGLVHAAQNLRDKPFRNLTIAFPHAQQNLRNRCSKVINDKLNDCLFPAALDPQSSSLMPDRLPLFESDEVLAELINLSPHTKYSEKKTNHAALLLGLENTEVKVRVSGESPTEVRSGGIRWLPVSHDWTFESGGKPSRFILLHFKDSTPDAKP
jgi:hypothetical protein